MKKKNKEEIPHLRAVRKKLIDDIQTLEKGKAKLEDAALNAEVYYSQIITNAAVMMTHLNKLEKIAGSFNKTVQMMNAGYFLHTMRNTVEEVKNPADPADVKIASVWSKEQKNYFDNSIYELSQRIIKSVSDV